MCPLYAFSEWNWNPSGVMAKERNGNPVIQILKKCNIQCFHNYWKNQDSLQLKKPRIQCSNSTMFFYTQKGKILYCISKVSTRSPASGKVSPHSLAFLVVLPSSLQSRTWQEINSYKLFFHQIKLIRTLEN